MIPSVSKHNVFYRAIHNINIAALMTEMFTSDLVAHPKENVSDLYKQYRHMLMTLPDRHEPESKSVSQKPSAWMTIFRMVTVNMIWPNILYRGIIHCAGST